MTVEGGIAWVSRLGETRCHGGRELGKELGATIGLCDDLRRNSVPYGLRSKPSCRGMVGHLRQDVIESAIWG